MRANVRNHSREHVRVLHSQRCVLIRRSLFGTPYDDKRYNDVLGACALVQDLEMCAASLRIYLC